MFKPYLDMTCELDNIQCHNNTTSPQNTENRRLDDIRPSLLNPNCQSDIDIAYSIKMDVFDKSDKLDLVNRNLLYGVVVYAGGVMGEEIVHSQGHLHNVSKLCHSRTGEIYQIWDGEAIIYMQTPSVNDEIIFYAVHAKAGDIVIVHPEWFHATANISQTNPMTFGAWCIRDYGFEYDYIRAHKGMAFYPIINSDNQFEWLKNENYTEKNITFIEKQACDYHEYGLKQGVCIYQQYKNNQELFNFLTDPLNHSDQWKNFIP